MTEEDLVSGIRKVCRNALMDVAEQEAKKLLSEFDSKLNLRKMEIAASLANFMEIKLLDQGITGYTIQIIVKGMDSGK